MRSATSANGRTAQAAADGGQSAALTTSYNGGAVMGLAVGGLGLAGISLMYYLTQAGLEPFLTVDNIAGFGMGASSIALFARVGGGIYTKAADVGADLVGRLRRNSRGRPQKPGRDCRQRRGQRRRCRGNGRRYFRVIRWKHYRSNGDRSGK